MKFIKIQQDLLKQIGKEKGSLVMGKYCISDGNVIFTLEGHWAVIIPKEQFYLAFEKAFGNNGTANLVRFIVEKEELKEAIPTNVSVSIGEMECRKLMVDGIDVYVDKKFLTYFNTDSKFYGKDNKSPIFIYEKEVLVGFILPACVNE